MLHETDKVDVYNAIAYLAERLATVPALIDSPAPGINFLELVPRGDGGRYQGPAKSMLIDVTRGLARRVPLAKLVALYSNMCPYLALLMVSVLHRAKDKLVIPDDLDIKNVAV